MSEETKTFRTAEDALVITVSKTQDEDNQPALTFELETKYMAPFKSHISFLNQESGLKERDQTFDEVTQMVAELIASLMISAVLDAYANVS